MSCDDSGGFIGKPGSGSQVFGAGVCVRVGTVVAVGVGTGLGVSVVVGRGVDVRVAKILAKSRVGAADVFVRGIKPRNPKMRQMTAARTKIAKILVPSGHGS